MSGRHRSFLVVAALFGLSLYLMGCPGSDPEPLQPTSPVPPTEPGPAQNSPPLLSPIDDKIAYQGELLTFSVTASDPENKPLTFLSAELPEGSSFDAARHIFSWTPAAVGVFQVRFGVSDGSLEDWETVTLTVNPERPLRLNIIYYGKHEAEQDARILKVRPQYLISNPAHGLWGEAYGYKTWWLLQDIQPYHAAGIKVIGYLTSGYEGTGSGSGIDLSWYSLDMNKKLIKNMAEMDRVDGVFIDECSAFPDAAAKQYLKELTGLIHSYGLIAWGNVGQADFDPWFFTDGGFDLMHSVEQWRGQQLNSVQQQWANRISVTGFNAGYSLQDAVRLTLDAWNKGLAFCYMGTEEYNTLPPWLEEYAAALRASGKLTP